LMKSSLFTAGFFIFQANYSRLISNFPVFDL
jgi:hypothetical protein